MPSTIAAVCRAVSSSSRASFCSDIDGNPHTPHLYRMKIEGFLLGSVRSSWLLKLVRSSLRNRPLWCRYPLGGNKTNDYEPRLRSGFRPGRRDHDSPG